MNAPAQHRAADLGSITFDKVCRELTADNAADVVPRLIADVDQMRRSMDVAQWRRFIEDVARPHALAALLREDPYTRRAFDKPRGYAGDAVMLDYVYDGLLSSFRHAPSVTALGRAIFAATIRSKSADAVRARRQGLASYVDDTAARVANPVIVSLACGHAREVELSGAMRFHQIGAWFCIDQDVESLGGLAERLARAAVVPLPGSVKAILRNRMALPEADFMYSAGLFDYLDDDVAAALLDKMFRATLPGGRLLIANCAAEASARNFASDSQERGYLEAFMDWWLIYRSEAELLRLSERLTETPRHVRTLRDPSGRAVYLELTK